MFDGMVKAEKKVLRVIRWLERCAAACRAGCSESAIMDMECARADFDNAREALWEANGRKYAQCASSRTWTKVVFTAAVILLFAAAPVSMQEVVAANNEAAFLEWVTPDEKILLSKLRSRFVESNLADIRTLKDREAPPAISAERVQKAEIPGTQEKKEQNKIDDAKMLYLIKTGERALRNDQVVVKVEKR